VGGRLGTYVDGGLVGGCVGSSVGLVGGRLGMYVDGGLVGGCVGSSVGW